MVETHSSISADKGVIYLVDDDQQFLHLIHSMLTTAGYVVHAFNRASEFLRQLDVHQTGCIVIDYKMPEMTGLELIRQVRERQCPTPFIVTTGFGDVRMAVNFTRMGAIEILEKPFHHIDLLRYVRAAIELDSKERSKNQEQLKIENRLTSLTRRERVVLNLMLEGKLTKQIGSHLGISPRTVEVHRRNIMRKMEAESVLHLVDLMRFESSTFRALPT